MAKAAAKIIHIPSSGLVVLVGVAGSGKSTFANSRFRATEILSSDHFRAIVSDDEGDQEATDDAFAVLHLVLDMRLRRGRLCVVDATNLSAIHRAKLLNVAHLYNRRTVSIVFDTPLDECITRAKNRVGRLVKPAVIREQAHKIAGQSDKDLLAEGFQKVVRLKPAERVDIRRSAAARKR